MNEKNRESRKAKRQGPSLLDEALERRIALYVLAAGATLASGSAAHAKVVFTPSNAIVYEDNTLQIDLNNDGIADFFVSEYFSSACSSIRGPRPSGKRRRSTTAPAGIGCYRTSYRLFVHTQSTSILARHVSGVTGKGIVAGPGFDDLAAALGNGARIGSGANFGRPLETMAFRNSVWEKTSGGNFLNVTNRALGVKFLINGEVHYGWIGFREANPYGAKLLGWAYETQPNTPISTGFAAVFAGLEEPPALRSAEPTSLELLAAGHVAVADWRRRNAAVIVPVASPS